MALFSFGRKKPIISQELTDPLALISSASSSNDLPGFAGIRVDTATTNERENCQIMAAIVARLHDTIPEAGVSVMSVNPRGNFLQMLADSPVSKDAVLLEIRRMIPEKTSETALAERKIHYNALKTISGIQPERVSQRDDADIDAIALHIDRNALAGADRGKQAATNVQLAARAILAAEGINVVSIPAGNKVLIHATDKQPLDYDRVQEILDRAISEAQTHSDTGIGGRGAARR